MQPRHLRAWRSFLRDKMARNDPGEGCHQNRRGMDQASRSAEETLPIADAVKIADECGGWHGTRGSGLAQQTQTRFVGEAVGFFLIHLAVSEDAVFPR